MEHRLEADRLREEAKRIIVWLELKSQDQAATRLDSSMADLREAMGDFQEACEGVYPPDEPRCRDAREAMIEAAGRVAGTAEDLQDELPEDVWEGFFDV